MFGSAPGQMISSGSGGGGQVDSVVAGANITVDNTDPANPVVSATGGGGSVIDEGPFACNAVVVVGDIVYMDETSGQLELARANAESTIPAVGFVVTKPTGTTATIRTDGTMTALTDDAGAPLTKGALYYVSTTVAGKITATPPSAGGQVVQKVGEAVSTSSLTVNLTSDYYVL